jgi:uncharacterized protein YjiS (DUF1127 family)
MAGNPAGHLSASFPATESEMSGLGRLAAQIKAQWAAIDGWQRRKATIAQLQGMDDHMLRDIGIHRSAIEFVVKNGRYPKA